VRGDLAAGGAKMSCVAPAFARSLSHGLGSGLIPNGAAEAAGLGGSEKHLSGTGQCERIGWRRDKYAVLLDIGLSISAVRKNHL